MSTADVSMSGSEVNELVALITDGEPLALRADLRHGAGEDPIVGKVAAVDEVTSMLWSSWKAELESRGFDITGFRAVVAGADHEVWLWIMGDRPYVQLVAALAGRALRRSRPASTGA
jgi:hypothetical protein